MSDCYLEVSKKVQRLIELEADIAHTRGWWQHQLYKHRPDLASKVEDQERELKALREDLNEIKEQLNKTTQFKVD
jgi:hypothetical protein